MSSLFVSLPIVLNNRVSIARTGFIPLYKNEFFVSKTGPEKTNHFQIAMVSCLKQQNGFHGILGRRNDHIAFSLAHIFLLTMIEKSIFSTFKRILFVLVSCFFL